MRPLALAIVAVLLALAPAAPVAAAAPPAAEQILVFLRLPPQHFRPNGAYGAYGDNEGRSARLRIASRLAREHGVSLVSEWPMPLLGVHCFVMRVRPGESAEETAERLASDPSVSWSEPLRLYEAQAAAAHNDPLYRVQPAAASWSLAELHRIATGRRVRVAVIDSLVDSAHPDLQGQVIETENFVATRAAAPEQHGTGVAGVIAARANNGMGIAGVAPGARILALRACWQEGPRTLCDSLSLARALDHAVGARADVINMSLSGPASPLLARLLDKALARGVVVVGAFDGRTSGGGFPASHRGVLAVVEQSDGAATPGVLAAPGRDVPTTHPGGRWHLVSGSSYAAAHVSGLVALLRERTPTRHSRTTPVFARTGARIDACATLVQRWGPCDCSCTRPREIPTSSPE